MAGQLGSEQPSQSEHAGGRPRKNMKVRTARTTPARVHARRRLRGGRTGEGVRAGMWPHRMQVSPSTSGRRHWQRRARTRDATV